MQNNVSKHSPASSPEQPDVAAKPPTLSEQTAPVAWEEFLEEDADCCGGCHHKPR